MRFHHLKPQSLLPTAAHDRLHHLQARPEMAGERVYGGTVYPLRGMRAERAVPLFTYTRHVRQTDQGQEASHLTYNLQGQLIIEERVTLTPRHMLLRMDVANRQTGHAGSVWVDADARRLHYTWGTARTTRTARENLAPDTLLVAGPNLHGTLLRHWDLLKAGLPLQVRMLVPARRGSYGFTVRRAAPATATSDATIFVATPSNLLLRWAVAPLRTVFDTQHRTLLRYEGRVPPRTLAADGRLRDLDACVHYTPQLHGYR